IVCRAVDSPVGKLNKKEREITFSPDPPPILDHRRKQLTVLGWPISVRFSLVPDGPPDCVRSERHDHGIEEAGRTPGIPTGVIWDFRGRGHWRSVGLGLIRFLSPV